MSGPARLCPSCRAMHPAGTTCGLRSVGPVPAAQHAVGIAISDEVAARAWTSLERWQVDMAIERVAQLRAEFTTDAVWALLGADFPVTKGMAGRLMAAKHGGLIEPTDRVVFSKREGEHGHGQRLTVWRSLVYGGRKA